MSLVSDLNEEESKYVTQFGDRTERWIDLAQLCVLYGLDDADKYIMRAADCMIGYGWRKDVWIFDVLSAVEMVQKSGKADVRPWLETLAPFIDQITRFTDGDETRHCTKAFGAGCQALQRCLG